jgi:hypothetical protein
VIWVKLNIEVVRHLIKSKGWSEGMFALKLGLDYTYVYRVMRGERGIGKKFILGLIKFCDREGLNFKEFVIIM